MASAADAVGREDYMSETAALSAALESTSLSDAGQPPQSDTEKAPAATNATRPLRIYTRAQLLHLHRSPLVQPPPDMPELKSWFGTENEQNLAKKDVDQSTPGGSRDRRPSFRSTLTQPSQMGNFKHQSLRDRDKDRDKDGDKDRERDIRDREGQERLRHLSDKYDRDRLNLSTTNARTKDREGGSSSTRANSQGQPASTTSRRGEARETSKRKMTEPADDWRRGDSSRNTREDRDATTRRDRDRSRPPSSRRERGAEREDARERSTRDRGDDDDETRHWRDDGKRDERVAARKARERGGDHWEPSSDRRWAVTDEKDGRYKRTNGRERRNGGQDEGRDRDDRKERDREREKEKEPAWMETYVPNEPLPGILGGVASSGELDGIQAWKKGLKDKEKDEKDSARKEQGEVTALSAGKADKPVPEEKSSAGMDEIQLFRLLMQKEQGKREPDPIAFSSSETTSGQVSIVPVNDPKRIDGAPSTFVHSNEPKSTNALDTPIMVGQGAPSSRPSVPSKTTAILNPLPSEKALSEPHFNPPSGPRLLSLGRGNKPQAQLPTTTLSPQTPPVDTTRSAAGFSPFEDAFNQSRILLERGGHIAPPPDGLQRLQPDRSPHHPHQVYAPGPLDNTQIDPNGNGYSVPKGSRFAKFFDGKTREPVPPKAQTPTGFTSPSPNPAQRYDQGSYTGPSNNADDHRAMDDIIAMLANSQAHRSGQNVNTTGLPPVQHNTNTSFNGHGVHPLLHQQHHPNANRSESLYDSRLDDRSFVPDGMVPGLRTAPPTRARDNYTDSMDDPLIHLQRLAQQQQLQHRADPNFGAPVNSMFNQQQTRGVGLPQHQQQSYRGGPSPNPLQQLGMPPARGIPPGLANLGSRPPHEASQFLGLPGGPTGLSLAALSNGGQMHPQQQQFNGFNNNSNIGNLPYGGHQQQFRGPGPAMNLQNTGAHIPLGNVSQNNMDPRLAAQFGVGAGIPVGGRGLGGNILPPHQRPGPQMQGPHMGMRGQQQQLPPHMMPHMHHSSQSPQGPTNGPAQDLMALLMGGTLRE
ncbi:hypothetical protein DFP72DRAFT_866272 [Ephemerocybe angulata]|uniref:Uncharacterized protein n=1 Tax=Ephemerocybe angulata TaxID=980116 RepID=A0A8H6IJX8_9AGAR|nr:hypothetical protein DFP72DRAFT_866272 [Tulosesus angulatus]